MEASKEKKVDWHNLNLQKELEFKWKWNHRKLVRDIAKLDSSKNNK